MVASAKRQLILAANVIFLQDARPVSGAMTECITVIQHALKFFVTIHNEHDYIVPSLKPASWIAYLETLKFGSRSLSGVFAIDHDMRFSIARKPPSLESFLV